MYQPTKTVNFSLNCFYPIPVLNSWWCKLSLTITTGLTTANNSNYLEQTLLGSLLGWFMFQELKECKEDLNGQLQSTCYVIRMHMYNFNNNAKQIKIISPNKSIKFGDKNSTRTMPVVLYYLLYIHCSFIKVLNSFDAIPYNVSNG